MPNPVSVADIMQTLGTALGSLKPEEGTQLLEALGKVAGTGDVEMAIEMALGMGSSASSGASDRMPNYRFPMFSSNKQTEGFYRRFPLVRRIGQAL